MSNRVDPSTNYIVYTNYQSDASGEYTCFIGTEVSLCQYLDENKFTSLTIPSQKYVKFTNGPGPIPEVSIEAWKEIWAMSEGDPCANRSYISDFEVYDERAIDPQNAILDIYIGIKN